MKKPGATFIQYLKGIGPKRARLLNKLGIKTVEDLLYYFPRRYEDRRQFSKISQIQEGQRVTLRAKILAKGQRQSWKRRGFDILEAAVGDDTGKVFCVWFNQPYLGEYLKINQELILHGEVKRYESRLQLNSPEFEIISGGQDQKLSSGRIVPVYTLPAGITQRYLRRIIKFALDKYLTSVNDFLPYDIRSRNKLLNLIKSLINIHFPQDFDLKKQAYQRLAFEEFFLFQVLLALRKSQKRSKKNLVHRLEPDLSSNFIRQLPFKLTAAQNKVLEEIKQDMAGPFSMHRLLQGDVGSGKTVVATLATLTAIQNRYQAAFLVPTEILAKQHYKNIKNQISKIPATKIGGSAKNFGGKNKSIKVALLTSGINKKAKDKVYEKLKKGEINLIIGTHALLEESLEFKKLSLVVIDEQHKFGVGQRCLLPEKGNNPDVLIMTATPIPRTLAITIYADLDISVINELPAGRKPINTQCIGNDRRAWLYAFMKEKIRQGRQAYVVYPIIEESFALDLLSAEKMYAEFKDNIFKEFNVGLIHARLSEKEQDRIMAQFRQGKIQVLIATTVLEVGIDVSNACLMVIENAERFGLAQLHQLRGRIGRGTFESFCILISDTQSPEARMRLSAMEKYSDGFLIAEEDLKIRGPGEFFGRRQHGLSELKLADPLSQMQLLRRARQEARNLINLDAELNLRQNALLKEKLLQRFPEYEKLMVVG